MDTPLLLRTRMPCPDNPTGCDIGLTSARFGHITACLQAHCYQVVRHIAMTYHLTKFLRIMHLLKCCHLVCTLHLDTPCIVSLSLRFCWISFFEYLVRCQHRLFIPPTADILRLHLWWHEHCFWWHEPNHDPRLTLTGQQEWSQQEINFLLLLIDYLSIAGLG